MFRRANAALGRTNSAEEKAHLAESDRHFGQAASPEDPVDQPAKP